MHRVIFLLTPDVEILDLAGPLQALHEANQFGADYSIELCALSAEIASSQNLRLSNLQKLPEPQKKDLILLPGIPSSKVERTDAAVCKWLLAAHRAGAQISSICTGAFLLGYAGLLDGRKCTTHWKCIDRLQRLFPAAKVLSNRMFVEDGNITTSAGVAAGIDLALAIIERHHGPKLATDVAREMVVYFRRNETHKQESIYLEHRSHMHPAIHHIQDLLIANPVKRSSLPELAAEVNMSERHLTRLFKEQTGITIGDYIARLRLEMSKRLLTDSDLSLEEIARLCGFNSSRQFRRLCSNLLGMSPGKFRESNSN